MAVAVAAIGATIALLGLVAMLVPVAFRELIGGEQGPRALYIAVGARLAVGVFFLIASRACAWPEAIGTVGVAMLAAGFVGLFMGLDRIRLLMAWFMARSDTAFRSWAVLAVATGVFIVYAAVLSGTAR